MAPLPTWLNYYYDYKNMKFLNKERLKTIEVVHSVLKKITPHIPTLSGATHIAFDELFCSLIYFVCLRHAF